MARVSEVHPDPHDIVRTVTVKMRPRDARERVLPDPPYLLPKPPTELKIGIQRVVVVLPVEEQTCSGNRDLLDAVPTPAVPNNST